MTGGMEEGPVSARKVGDCMRGRGARVFPCRRSSLLAGPQEAAAPMPPVMCPSPSSETRFQRCAARGRGEAARAGSDVTGKASRAPIMTRCPCCPPPTCAPPHSPLGVSERPAAAVAPRSQPVGRSLAARAQTEGRARCRARARHEGRGTRDRSVCPLRRRTGAGGSVLIVRCWMLDAWRACLPDGRRPTRREAAQNSEF